MCSTVRDTPFPMTMLTLLMVSTHMSDYMHTPAIHQLLETPIWMDMKIPNANPTPTHAYSGITSLENYFSRASNYTSFAMKLLNVSVWLQGDKQTHKLLIC